MDTAAASDAGLGLANDDDNYMTIVMPIGRGNTPTMNHC